MARKIVFCAKGEVGLEEYEASQAGAGQLKVRSLSSLVSTGTENIILNCLYAPGSHWDKWLKNEWPFYPGYATIGEVVETGEGVKGWVVGQKVALRKNHASEHVVDAGECILCPEEINPQEAAWFALAKITFMGVKAAGYFLGDTVLVIGAGPIGQMAVRWALAAGCQKVVVCDTLGSRLQMALDGGASSVISSSLENCEEELRGACGGNLPDVVMDSTGNARVFQSALKLAGKGGRVVLMGDTGFPASQNLSSDVMMKGLRITGAHDTHETAHWTGERIYGLFFDLLRQQRIKVEGLNTHVYKPEQVEEAYREMNENRGATMGVVFDWN